MNDILWIFVTKEIDQIKDYKKIDNIYGSKLKNYNNTYYLFIDQRLKSINEIEWHKNSNLTEIIKKISNSTELGNLLINGSINILFHDKHIGINLSAETPEKGNPCAEVLNDVNLLESTFDSKKKMIISFVENIGIPNFKREKKNIYKIGSIKIHIDNFFIFRHESDGICYQFIKQVAQGNINENMSKDFSFFFKLKHYKRNLYELRCKYYRNYPFYTSTYKEIETHNTLVCDDYLKSKIEFKEAEEIMQKLKKIGKTESCNKINKLKELLQNPIKSSELVVIQEYAEEVRNTFNIAIASLPYAIYD